jgi:hypothetical protein
MKSTKYIDAGDFLVGESFWHRHQEKDPDSDCILWTAGMHVQGYGMCGVKRKADDKYMMATTHRIAMRMKLGRAIDRKENVIHTCEHANCVNPDHLYIGTHSTVQRASRAKGRRKDTPRGRYVRDHKMQNRQYKYSIDEMLFIRNSTSAEIAERYNITKKRASQLRYGMRIAYNWLKEYETK